MKIFVRCIDNHANIATLSDVHTIVIVKIVDPEKQFKVGHEYKLMIAQPSGRSTMMKIFHNKDFSPSTIN